MNEGKGLLSSMGVWGGVVSLLPVLDAVHAWLQASQATLPPAMQWVTVGVGAVLSIFGRVKATEKITKLF